MELQLFEANNGDCPYLDTRQWLSYIFKTAALDGSIYESLIDHGFRRSGLLFYKNNCQNCSECISLRVLVKAFKPSKSQRKVWNKNQDITVTRQPVSFDQESYELYAKYSVWKHGSRATEANYEDFLVKSAVETMMMKYYLDSRLAGIGWVDVLPRSLSSVYYAFHPEFAKRSLGVYSVLKEIELAKSLNKNILHLGFWVDNCSSMDYKQHYQPYELLINGRWTSTLQAN